MNHYFIPNETLPVNERDLHFSFMERVFIFKTNSGLFSYREVDYASRLLMENIPPLSGTLLDMGCGYGAIGITLAKTYGLELTMCDINSEALKYTAVNADRNGLYIKSEAGSGGSGKGSLRAENILPEETEPTERGLYAKIILSDGLASVEGKYDTIVTNPPIHAGKEVIFRMYEEASRHLNGGGAFYIVVQKKHGAESHAAALEKIFETVEVRYKKKGYFIFAARSNLSLA